MSEVDLRKFKDLVDSVLRENCRDLFQTNTDKFWHFLERFQQHEAVQNASAKHKYKQSADSDSKRGHHRAASSNSHHNFRINLKDSRLRPEVSDRLLTVLSHYFAFVQASRFKALQKIEEDRRSLPIFTSKQQIRDALLHSDVLIVAGDTGCGKSTQVPQYLAEFGYRRIAVTQPRRIACISLASRVAFERHSASDVGYQIRFDKQSNSRSCITFMTEGVLLRKLSGDSLIAEYDVLVLDEVHERHVFTDFLLGVARCLLRARRGSLKVILMSATINLELFENYLRRFDSPVITVSGRLYPIRVEYKPISGVSVAASGQLRTVQRTKFDPSPYVRVLELIDARYSADDRGDLLVFLSGITEIRAVFSAVRTYADSARSRTADSSKVPAKWLILALHSSLAAREQDRVFALAPDGYRRCILATNIAETSVTIDRVRFVVDSGRVRELCYDPHSRIERLEEFWISRASAEQRKGRAGRTGPGVCFRLYSEADYNAFNAYSPAEIHRVSLDSLVLQMVVLGLSNPLRFPFIEPVEPKSLERSLRFLEEQQALRCNAQAALGAKSTEDESTKPKATGDIYEPTSIGRMLANLPVDVPIGKMLILSAVLGEQETAITLCCAALLSSQPIFANRLISNSRREDDEPLDDAAIARLRSDCGDLLTAGRHLAAWLRIKTRRDARDSRKWARRHGVEEQRLYEVIKLRRQFARIISDSSLLDRLRRQSDSCSDSDSDSDSESDSRKRPETSRNSFNKSSFTSPARKKRRYLKLLGDEPASDSESDADADANDRQMRSRKDELEELARVADQLEELDTTGIKSSSSRNETNALVTFVLCYGLHSQVAVGDEFNAARAAFSEFLFHTSSKQFVSLHPSTCFVHDPELLKRTCTTTAASSKSNSADSTAKKDKRSPSTRPELLLHATLLETSKAYLINVLRVPALQTLLLFSHLETNSDCSRVVCDGWLELSFTRSDDAERALRKAVSIRDGLEHILDSVLKPIDNANESDKESGDDSGSESSDHTSRKNRKEHKHSESRKRKHKRKHKHKHKRKSRRSTRGDEVSMHARISQLRSEIASFYRMSVPATLRRVLPSELNHLYRASNEPSSTSSGSTANPMGALQSNSELVTSLNIPQSQAGHDSESTSSVQEAKGGQKVRPYLIINCLVDESEASVWNDYTLCMQRHFQCPKCGLNFIMDVADRIRHESECQVALTAAEKEMKQSREPVKSSSAVGAPTESSSATVVCTDCGSSCSSLGDLIRHRRTCQALEQKQS